MTRIVMTAICAAMMLTGTASAQTVKDKKTCTRAVADARQAMEDASVGDKSRKQPGS